MADRVSVGDARLHALFNTMAEELNDVPSNLPEENRFAWERQVARARKRAKFHRPHLRDQAIDKFIALNRSLDSTVVDLPDDIVNNARHFILRVLENYTTSKLGTVQSPLEEELLFDFWRFGPGSSNGVRGTHTAEKLEQPMTCTLLAIPLVQRLRLSNPYLCRHDSEKGWKGYVQVRGSRLSTVQKNEETDRTIAIEPSGNMALQLAAGTYIEEALRFIGLDIRKQPELNKFLAWLGSITGSLATIDLTSASDMFLILLVRLLWPTDWFRLFMAIRSHEIEVRPGQWEVMRMISTMGNGFTFPMMTLTLVALLYAYRARNGGPTLWVDWNHTGIFGDDIILRSDEYEGFTEVLTAAGLVVNHGKSYATGAFRESCGGDYYKGVNVTPVYIKRLDRDPDIFTAINTLLEWGAEHKKLLYRSIILLKSWLKGRAHLVPEWYGSDQGVRTAQCPQRFKYLQVVQHYVKYEGSFTMMLITGGYLEAEYDNKKREQLSLQFLPRPFKTRYRVVASRLPRGFRDGGDPLSRSSNVTDSIATSVAVLFG